MSDSETRARHAQQLLDDPLFREALGAIRDEAIKAWETTSARDTEAREIAWLTIKVLGRIEGVFKGMVDDGRIAAARVQAPVR